MYIALLLCACGRWERVTAKLIAAIEQSALLADDELDELAESFVAHEETVVFPLTWISSERVDAETGETTTVQKTTPGWCDERCNPGMPACGALRLTDCASSMVPTRRSVARGPSRVSRPDGRSGNPENLFGRSGVRRRLIWNQTCEPVPFTGIFASGETGLEPGTPRFSVVWSLVSKIAYLQGKPQ